MKLFYCFIFVFIASITLGSAATELNIYLDEQGDALFLGTTDNGATFPAGINVTEENIFGYTAELTRKEGDVWTFSYTADSTNMKVFLPEGSSARSITGNGTEISIERGQIVVYAENTVSISYVIGDSSDETSSTLSIILGVAAIIIATLLIVFAINFNSRENTPKKKIRKPKKSIDKLAIVSSVLNDRENAILQKLRETGKVKSSFLRKAVDIPKASFSRHIHELERKKLIQLSGEGKNKFIELV